MKDLSQLPEKQLVILAKSSELAFNVLYEKYFKRIYGFLYLRLQNKVETEEVNSTAWFEILQSLDRFDPKDDNSFGIWVFRIARNCLNDYFRKKMRLKNIEVFNEDNNEAISTDPRIEDSLSELDMKQLQECVVKLPPAYQSCLIMRFYNDMKNKEIAEILGISEKTVASNIVRAIAKLREIYNSTQ